MTWLHKRTEAVLFTCSTALLLLGGAGWLLGAVGLADGLWLAGTVLGLGFSIVWTVGAIRRRQPSVDIIALLALAGALWVGELFAGAMITVMLASGQLLEARAAARARRELSLLVGRAPRTARRRVDGGVVEVPVNDVAKGDWIVVGTGEVVPVDGRLVSGGILDEAALTGESMPVERPVVATPCPLLLAAPIAIMSGLARAAHIGVVI